MTRSASAQDTPEQRGEEGVGCAERVPLERTPDRVARPVAIPLGVAEQERRREAARAPRGSRPSRRSATGTVCAAAARWRRAVTRPAAARQMRARHAGARGLVPARASDDPIRTVAARRTAATLGREHGERRHPTSATRAARRGSNGRRRRRPRFAFAVIVAVGRPSAVRQARRLDDRRAEVISEHPLRRRSPAARRRRSHVPALRSTTARALLARLRPRGRSEPARLLPALRGLLPLPGGRRHPALDSPTR